MLRLLAALLPLVPAISFAADYEAPALVRSKARLELRSSLSLPVSKAPFADGTRFKKGTTLVAFDCRTLSAEGRAAKAAMAAEALSVSSKKRLVAHGAAGTSELKHAKALHRRAASQRDAIASRMRSCKMKAPFSGRVVKLAARPMEIPAPGQPVITIIDDTRLEVEVVAPSNWLAWVRPGAAFTFAIEETGSSHVGKVRALGSEVDPVSRTVRLFGTIDSADGVLPGMSGRVLLDGPQR